jgi:rhodanese-related sulfurtransferase
LSRARAFAERSGVRVISPAELAAFAGDATRTLYVLDVRDPAEFAAGHLQGSVSAPGGQLVQATDTWVGVRGACIALIDDDGMRARMAGAWLRQMGFSDVFVVEGGLNATAVPRRAAAAEPEVPTVDAATLAAANHALVVDLARSIEFRDGHIPGAHWGIRSRLDALREPLGTAKRVVLTSPDGVLARLALAEAKALTPAPVQVLDGGTATWTRAGKPLEHDRTNPPDAACVDAYLRPYDRNSGVEEAMRAYLAWEIDLVHEIARDGTVRFGV